MFSQGETSVLGTLYPTRECVWHMFSWGKLLSREMCLGYVPFRNGAWEAMSPPADHLGLYKRERNTFIAYIAEACITTHSGLVHK